MLVAMIAHDPQPPSTPEAPRRERPVLTWIGRIALAGAIICAAIALGFTFYDQLTPGGMDFGLAMIGLFIALLGLVPLLALGIVGIVERRWRRPLAAGIVVAVVAVGMLIAGAQPLRDWHWQWMRGDLEAAEAAGECPARAGISVVLRCAGGPDGMRLYYFGGGFLNTNFVAKPTPEQRAALEAQPPGAPHEPFDEYWHVLEDLGDGWYLVVNEW